MKKLLLFICILVSLPILAADPPLYGSVKVVEHYPDYKVKVVTSYPDLLVKKVDSSPDKPGLWKFVDSYPDFTVQFVDSYADFTIMYVEHYPGIPLNGSKFAFWPTQDPYSPISPDGQLCYVFRPQDDNINQSSPTL